MIILEKPYISDFLIETIKKNNFLVLNSDISRKFLDKNFLVSSNEAVKKVKSGDKIYSDSENSIDWVLSNLADNGISKMINISKDKALFREKIKQIYPDYYFKKVLLKDLNNVNPDILPYPVILKPSVGFLSFGVYPIKSKSEWIKVADKINSEIEKFKEIFPKSVVNCDEFIIEKMIIGDEFALDAYFDEKGKATILNIFQHPFFDDKDVSDRAYFTSAQIIRKFHDKFKAVLDKIGSVAGYKNFPFHLELRVEGNEIIPIELNPMRFCGWCITDIAYFAYGINPYEYYFKGLKPDWNKVLEGKNEIYYFTMADIPNSIDNEKIKNVDYEKYLSNIKNPLEIRKIDPKNNPVFAIVFAKTPDLEEIKNILKVDMSQFIEV